MTLNQQAASGQVADDVEIAAMVAGKDGSGYCCSLRWTCLLAASYRPRPWPLAAPRLGTVMPADFIPSINRQGLDRKLFERVSVRVIEMLQTMRRAGVAVPIAINAPASTLSDAGRSKRCCASAPPSCPPRCCGWS